jgi:hypothetical protein
MMELLETDWQADELDVSTRHTARLDLGRVHR